MVARLGINETPNFLTFTENQLSRYIHKHTLTPRVLSPALKAPPTNSPHPPSVGLEGPELVTLAPVSSAHFCCLELFVLAAELGALAAIGLAYIYACLAHLRGCHKHCGGRNRPRAQGHAAISTFTANFRATNRLVLRLLNSPEEDATSTVVGVDRPRAQGHATTSTFTANFRATNRLDLRLLNSPKEDATSTAVGVARPRAQGHATTSTSTANFRATNRLDGEGGSTPPQEDPGTCKQTEPKGVGLRRSILSVLQECFVCGDNREARRGGWMLVQAHNSRAGSTRCRHGGSSCHVIDCNIRAMQHGCDAWTVLLAQPRHGRRHPPKGARMDSAAGQARCLRAPTPHLCCKQGASPVVGVKYSNRTTVHAKQ
eukprot:1139903-Pelagomonas_calceolata.AAC.4